MPIAYSGKKRIAKKLNPWYFTKPWYRATLDYLLRAQPGDLIHACTGYNHRIATLEVAWKGHRKTRIATEVWVVDQDEGCHGFPGGGCVSLPEAREAIEEYARGWDDPARWDQIEEWKFTRLAEDILKLRRGEHSVDENGLRLHSTDSGLPLAELVQLLRD